MNRREASKRETRALILTAARQLFLKKGAGKCTMREIARAAGVSPASVVVHFQNKTALLETTLYEDIESAVSRAVETLPAAGGIMDLLMHVARTMFIFYDTNRELYRILIRDTWFEPEPDALHPGKLDRQFENYLYFFSNMIEQEKAKGRIRSDADAVLAAESLFFLYFSVLMDFLRKPEVGVETAIKKLAALGRQHLYGIMRLKKKG